MSPGGPDRTTKPRKTLAVALACGLALLGGCQRTPPARPNVLLISIDTLRADHVGVYGYRLDTTPTIDALAARGVRFADATVAWPKTWPSMAAILTGKYPKTNGIRLYPRRPVPADNVMLAEALRDAGYATGAVVANMTLRRANAFDQGFDHFVESWAEEAVRVTGASDLENTPGLVKRFTDGRLVTDQAITTVDELRGTGKPFFLWLHYIDPHGPYLPPEEYRMLFAGAHPSTPVPIDDLPPYQRQTDPVTGVVSNDIGFYMTQYDREIRAVDAQIGRLVGALDERGLIRETLIVLTADHGESMDENRYYLEHGNVPYQTNAAVPLILALDGHFDGGRVVEQPVNVIDVFATVLASTGTPPPNGVASTDLLPLVRGERTGQPYVFMESGKKEPFQLVARKASWKLVYLRSPEDRAWLGRPEIALYDLSRDPTEQTDLRAAHPDVANELMAALVEWKDTTPRYPRDVHADTDLIDDRTQSMLRALGYLE